MIVVVPAVGLLLWVVVADVVVVVLVLRCYPRIWVESHQWNRKRSTFLLVAATVTSFDCYCCHDTLFVASCDDGDGCDRAAAVPHHRQVVMMVVMVVVLLVGCTQQQWEMKYHKKKRRRHRRHHCLRYCCYYCW